MSVRTDPEGIVHREVSAPQAQNHLIAGKQDGICPVADEIALKKVRSVRWKRGGGWSTAQGEQTNQCEREEEFSGHGKRSVAPLAEIRVRWHAPRLWEPFSNIRFCRGI